jgi:arylsulfatase A-like enzyme
VRDSDARVGEVVAAVERAGALERTAFVVIADHGMEQADPAVNRTWAEELGATGVAHRDVGGGLIYLD